MRRSIAVVAAILTVSLGLLTSLPAEAGNKHGHKHGFKHGYGHGYGKGYKHAYHRGYKHGYRHHKKHWHRRHHGHGHDGDKFLAAVGIIAGAHLIESYIHRPRDPQPAPVVYAAPIQPRPCYQVMVPYAHPYGGYYYAPQLQCY